MRGFSICLAAALLACSGNRDETIRSISSVEKGDAAAEVEGTSDEPDDLDASEPEPDPALDASEPEPDAAAASELDAAASAPQSEAGAGIDASDTEADVTVKDANVCIPSGVEICNKVDDDCNGIVDDVDIAGDGITDCLHILLIGNPGLQSSSDFQQWLTGQGASVTRVNTASAEPLTAQLLAGHEIAILDFLVRAYTEGEAAVLRDWVEQGGALMSLNGHSGSSDAMYGNSLLAPLGIQHVAGLRSGPVTSFETHPLTTGLSSVTFSGGYALRLDGPPPNTVLIASLPALAGASTPSPVAYAQDRGKGRVYVWGDEWVTFDSQWRSMPMIQQFWINALGWLAHQR